MPRAIFLDRKKVIERLARLARRAKAKDENIKQIVLFGSLATETYTTRSDADLLIILKESRARFLDRIPGLLSRFLDAPVAVDVFPYTDREARRVPLAKRALKTGILLA